MRHRIPVYKYPTYRWSSSYQVLSGHQQLQSGFEKDATGHLQTNVFHKETSVNAYLHASSAHPPHMIKAVPYGQYLRARRICSSETAFKQQADDLRKRFKERGYSNRNIKQPYNRARTQSRQQLLQPKQAPLKNEQILLVLGHVTSDIGYPAQQKLSYIMQRVPVRRFILG